MHFTAHPGGDDDLAPIREVRERLQEAHRLLPGEDLDATGAGYRVGYRDVSHFNREYRSPSVSPDARRAPAASSGGGARRLLSKKGTALRADEKSSRVPSQQHL
jgi:AraC-like DNA-binding protein